MVKAPSIWRTSTFRLVALYALVFCVSIGALICFVQLQINAYMYRQIDDELNWARRYFVSFPVSEIDRHIESRVARDHLGHSHYAIFTPERVAVVGDIRTMPAAMHANSVPYSVASLDLTDGQARPDARALATRLADGRILLVAYDAGDWVEITDGLLKALAAGGVVMLVVGVGGVFVWSVRPIRRILEVQRIAQRVVRGDLKQRMPVTGQHDELDMMSGIINHMLGDIEGLVGEVKSVCDAIAHDLRTPLARLHTLLHGLESTFEDDEPRRHTVQQAIDQTDTLLGRFAALLRVSEIEQLQRRSGFSELDLDGLLTDIHELYAPLADAKQVEFELDLRHAAAIHGDRGLLFEAISNLVDNAIKFAPQGGKVALGVRKLRAGCIAIDVCDNGPGIPEEEHEAVQKRFYRGRRNQSEQGHGLGLSIVAAVARLHEFRLEIGASDGLTRISIHCDAYVAPPLERPNLVIGNAV
ncbi:sensor histidine kinase [Pararobbsia silviterrae]|uniref:histidine kinase n=1 Tax=Pararobbsia silviterrae TaxID=1792498 RepID=A0A494XV18_9BURK|nr:ATP-binding protein [Pararobbsia silviterrae]RKP51944.1 HAMP domain-containing protein [Pararobbsia silviterrae]